MFVYILWGVDERVPLYVGRTTRLLSRLGTHDARFGKDIHGVELIRCHSMSELVEEEKRLIRYYKPTYNIADKQRKCAYCDNSLPPGVHSHRRCCDDCYDSRIWPTGRRADRNNTPSDHR